MATNINLRNAKREDCKEIRRLIQELADFEKIPDWIKIDVETLEKDGFDNEHPLYKCIVAEDSLNPNELIGYALYFIGYASWIGKRLFIEDIMVTEKYRRTGIGSKLFTKLCQEAVKLDCNIINFIVLNWSPANEFYKKLGAEDLSSKKGYHFYNLDLEKIKIIASQSV